jgi:hypothetical protein
MTKKTFNLETSVNEYPSVNFTGVSFFFKLEIRIVWWLKAYLQVRFQRSSFRSNGQGIIRRSRYIFKLWNGLRNFLTTFWWKSKDKNFDAIIPVRLRNTWQQNWTYILSYLNARRCIMRAVSLNFRWKYFIKIRQFCQKLVLDRPNLIEL